MPFNRGPFKGAVFVILVFFYKKLENRAPEPPGAWEAAGRAQNNEIKLYFESEVTW